MHNRTLAKSLSEGIISHKQAIDILNYLFDIITDGDEPYIQFIDCNDHSLVQGFCNLSSGSPEGFKPEIMIFHGIEDIKTENKENWIIYALTTPFSFEGDSSEYKSMSLEKATKDMLSNASTEILEQILKRGIHNEDTDFPPFSNTVN